MTFCASGARCTYGPCWAKETSSPWRADKIAGGYVVRDANGRALAYIYSRDNEADALQAKVLTKDEARRIAVNIARLPQLAAGSPC